MALKRPILVGGLGLSATLWLLDTVHFDIFDSSTLFSAMAVGTGLWWWRQRDRIPPSPASAQPLVANRSAVEATLEKVQDLIQTLAEEADTAAKADPLAETITRFQSQHQTLQKALNRQQLTIAVTGEARTGKSTLLKLIQAVAVVDADLSKLALREVSLSPEQGLAEDEFAVDDAVILVTDGDLTASALNLMKARIMDGQGVVLAFNKTDHYDAADQETILHQLHQHMTTLPVAVDVVGIAAAPRPIKVRRHGEDGTVTETMEPAPVAVEPLYSALKESLVAQTQALVAATTLRQVQELRRTVQIELNALRRDLAQGQVDQLQWVAAAAAFANPVPTIDLLATVAINGQLIMDLGKVYGFNLSLEEAKTAAGTLASLTVKLGLVELSTQVLTTVLKSHFATYLAGGLVQGLSAAYLTRMAGLSLIEYFEESALAGTPTTEISWDAIANRLKSAIQQNGQARFLQALAQQGIEKLKPNPQIAMAAAE
jgi:uncharacterized protein (DUF697 family)